MRWGRGSWGCEGRLSDFFTRRVKLMESRCGADISRIVLSSSDSGFFLSFAL